MNAFGAGLATQRSADPGQASLGVVHVCSVEASCVPGRELVIACGHLGRG